MYNIRASLQKYKIKKIHQKSPDRETVFNYHLNSGLTFNNHGFDTGKYDDPSVVAILTDSPNPSNYWKVLKHRLRKEGNESVTNCNQLKLPSTDGKYVQNRRGYNRTAVPAYPIHPIALKQNLSSYGWPKWQKSDWMKCKTPS